MSSSSLRSQLAVHDAIARAKPQNADEAARLEQFIAAHPDLLRAFSEIPAKELPRLWMLRQMRLSEALERQRRAIVQAVESIPELKQKLEALKKSGPRQKPGDMGPKISF